MMLCLMALSDTIEQNAAAPQTMTVDGQTATQQPLAQQIAADRYLSAKAAQLKQNRGIRFNKILPAGPMPDQQGTGFSDGNFDSPGG